MIGQILQAGWTFLQRMFGRLFDFLADLFGTLFQGLFDLLKLLFRPFFIVIGILLYFLYKVGELAVLLIKVFLALGKLFFAFVTGIFKTLAGFSFSSSPRSDGQWTSVFQNVVSGLESYQLSTLSYVLMFCVWFATGWAAIRIISSIRNGGD